MGGSLTEKMHILTGDFNCVLDKEIDRYPSRNYDDTGGRELKTIMTKNNLIDIWREKNPSVKKYTFSFLTPLSFGQYTFVII
jgi:exonuclease III